MNSVIRKLEQYSIESKMLLCQKYSQKLMTSDSLDLSIVVHADVATPTELEIFSLFSILYDCGSTQKITLDVFSEIITEIRNYLHPQISKSISDGTYSESFMMISGLTQFAVQENIIQRLYRYSYFFGFHNHTIDMIDVFRVKFGCDYNDFAFFAFCVFLISSAKGIGSYNKFAVLKFLFNKYNHIVKLLTISRDELLHSLRELHGDNEINYFYGLKIQYLFPLVEAHDGIYIPNPYLIINAATESLLNRLTEGNRHLRGNFGKHVLEQYLISIVSEIESDQTVSSEKVYYIGKNEFRTPDVIVVENNYCTMYDTKAIVPGIKLRELSEEKVKEVSQIIAENVVQLYNQISNYCNGYFCLSSSVEKNNVFGVVVLLEDNYISRCRIIDIALQMLRDAKEISLDEERFVRSNIKVLSLREIERAIFHKCSYLPFLIEQKNNLGKWYDFSYTSELKKNSVIRSLDTFLSTIKLQYEEMIKEISSKQ
jgi:hypothetical protein